ncbi:MAG: DUF6115 domain-containing protein [Clostridiales bacterium]|nr:DUF6115 domain-containing protein [Clostridiales bacterium]
MSMPEILLLIVAIALLVASFLVVGKEKESEGSDYKPELTKEEIEQIKLQVKEIIDHAMSNGIIEAEDKMSKISNEKIMAVNEYSAQLLDKIEQNNKEVVFLYDMLCQKDEEIKVMFQKMETIRRDNKEFLEKLALLMANKSKHKENVTKTVVPTKVADGEHMDHQKEKAVNLLATQKVDSVLKTNNYKNSMTKAEAEAETEVAITVEEDASEKRENILSLHKLNMSVLDISKQLGIGQGEVKLVIDLYSKKN